MKELTKKEKDFIIYLIDKYGIKENDIVSREISYKIRDKLMRVKK